ncbi:MAG: gamma-glutamyl-gamma-aminobutyrate hydrolase family protein [Lachnospiraceae bacterium]|nr:gamma-glutamyl-gamma-aminobutyrate hydrolase family protein [Lachnospiraceae bacterium]
MENGQESVRRAGGVGAEASARTTGEVHYPVIGVPMPGRGLLGQYRLYFYTRCLERAGAVVRVLEPEKGIQAALAAGERCHGFLFPGGPDLAPKLYGQEILPGCGKTDPARDAFELPLMQAALSARRPLFCIGRGMQLLNVARGGTLFQDITRRQEYPHMDRWHRAYATHPVELDTECLLAKLLDSDSATVNSLHHQAVDAAGEGLWITADSPEGFAEALELADYPFCLAVQWHPEYMAPQAPVQKQLFEGFVKACRQQALV